MCQKLQSTSGLLEIPLFLYVWAAETVWTYLQHFFILCFDLEWSSSQSHFFVSRKWLKWWPRPKWMKSLFLEQVASVECERPLRHQRMGPLGQYRRETSAFNTLGYTYRNNWLVLDQTHLYFQTNYPSEMPSIRTLLLLLRKWNGLLQEKDCRYKYPQIKTPLLVFYSPLGLVPAVRKPLKLIFTSVLLK